jgi:hypothetical protein
MSCPALLIEKVKQIISKKPEAGQSSHWETNLENKLSLLKI